MTAPAGLAPALILEGLPAAGLEGPIPEPLVADVEPPSGGGNTAGTEVSFALEVQALLATLPLPAAGREAPTPPEAGWLPEAAAGEPPVPPRAPAGGPRVSAPAPVGAGSPDPGGPPPAETREPGLPEPPASAGVETPPSPGRATPPEIRANVPEGVSLPGAPPPWAPAMTDPPGHGSPERSHRPMVVPRPDQAVPTVVARLSPASTEPTGPARGEPRVSALSASEPGPVVAAVVTSGPDAGESARVRSRPTDPAAPSPERPGPAILAVPGSLQDATTLDETRQEAEGHAREAPPRPAPGAASRPAETASATVQRSTPARAAADPPAVSPVASPAPGARLSSAVTVGEPMPAVERRPASPERPLEGRGAGPAGFTVLEAPTGAVSPSPGDPPAAEGRPPAPLRSPAVLEQVLDGARWLARPGRHEISLRLEPPELGAVHVRATLESGVLEIRIRAEVEPVQQALQQDLPRLRAALVELGLAPGRLTVELGLGGSRQEPGGWPGSADESSSRQPWRPAARGATIRPLPGVARLERWA